EGGLGEGEGWVPFLPGCPALSPPHHRSHREAEVGDVTVPHDVVLPFQAELPRLAALRLAPQADEVLVGHHLGADETTLDVAVDLARGLQGRRAAADRPGAALVLTRGEEADEIEER